MWILLLLANMAMAEVSIEPIQDHKAANIEQLFSQAGTPSTELLAEHPNWDCKFYGMQSRLQVARTKNFYQLAPQSPGKVKNLSNSHIVKTFAHSPHQLSGSTPKVKEQIKISSDKKTLISKFSSLKNNQLLAYALCK